MYKSVALFVAALAAVVVADDRVSVKGYTANVKASDMSCKFGSGDILKACGNCAKSIAECATAPNASAATTVCIKDISSFANDCGGCAVDILECL
ncbi:hypothetical protein ACI68E_004515 [Malassezia pachydermatis]|uniref:Fungal calcium binding protein domain-containing protein n=1 Tax=Malassezia pachydermatis TaxID=77020 RepID=A0A0M9VMM0_9BASI|nr:hypothetical protein Malapachy_0309 [Malassezia pachydermatis]KOS12419.1 hypothetical protein Malapachy_0309 [Malassezia pachydermatis]